MVCEEFEQLWNERLDARGLAPIEVVDRLDAHASSCPECRALGTRYALLQQAMEPPRPAPAVSADFTDRVLEALPETRAPFRFSSRRITAFALAAVMLMAAGLSIRSWQRPGRPEVAVRPTPPSSHLSDALADATSATWKLASETSRPAAKLGLDILETPEYPGRMTSLADSMRIEVDVTQTATAWQNVGDRVNARIAPISGTARQAFSFLLGPSATPKAKASTAAPRG